MYFYIPTFRRKNVLPDYIYFAVTLQIEIFHLTQGLKYDALLLMIKDSLL